MSAAVIALIISINLMFISIALYNHYILKDLKKIKEKLDIK